jgi:hypothetical protein
VADPTLDTDELARRFVDCTLPKAEWTHEAHLRVGLWHVRRYGADQTLALLRERISRYNESVGGQNTDDSGYHETITRAYVRLIAAFASANPDSKDAERRLLAECGDRDLPLRYYSRDRLFSVEARRGWVEPDLNDLP